MEFDLAEARERARTVFNATAAHFDDLTHWEICGRRTVELAGIQPGDRVLDVCCGTGASALAAAERVGPTGAVLGVDLADQLLEKGQAKAAARGTPWLTFQVGDMTALDVPDAGFDAVVCVFGVFFVPDMIGALRGLWRAVKPGGVLAITSWAGTTVFQPASDVFWRAVERERPDLRQPVPPWNRIQDPRGFAGTMVEAGLPEPVVVAETLEIPTDADRFWLLVEGSGYRGPLDRMGPEAAGRVRAEVCATIEQEGIRTLTAGVLYARSLKA